MKHLFPALRDALARGEDAVLCSILASRGSTPRGSGAHMAVFADGHSLGTVGGGAVEYECQKLAREALATKTSSLRQFQLSQAQVGMVCGGDVTVCLQYMSADRLPLLKSIADTLEEDLDSWLVFDAAEAAPVQMGLYIHGRGLMGADMDDGALRPLLKHHAASLGTLYAEPLTRARTVYVFGGGHVSQALVPLLAGLDFRLAVYEDRPEFCTDALFPQAKRRIVAPFDEILSHIDFKARDYAIVLTRGHECDYDALTQLLQPELSYLGVIGSRKKTAAVNAKLLQAGFSQRDLDRVHTPIGLPIGAKTPAEIAVSIAAELIAHRAREEET